MSGERVCGSMYAWAGEWVELGIGSLLLIVAFV